MNTFADPINEMLDEMQHAGVMIIIGATLTLLSVILGADFIAHYKAINAHPQMPPEIAPACVYEGDDDCWPEEVSA